MEKMHRTLTVLAASFTALPLLVNGALITAVPGPGDQGGMIMPLVSIVNADNNENPTSGEISINFNSESVPVLRSLEEWSPGSWFAEDAAWRADLGSPEGVGGTPATNAGQGDLFNNQYGFTFVANPDMETANVPKGKSLAIRLDSFSSPGMRSFNYENKPNRWDEVFLSAGSQVLWNDMMWHNYFTLPGDANPGTYTATFEIFIADQAFTPGTGRVDYSAAALAAAEDANFTSAFVQYDFAVIPEPTTVAMIAGFVALLAAALRRRILRHEKS